VSAWIDIKEAAARSGFSTKTLYRAIAAGELRATKVRSRWRIAVSDLEAWLRLPLAGPAWVGPVALRLPAPAEVGSLAALRLIETGHR
jgi:excisionase family DNA binding protein